jgi:nucleoside-diphosphate-sugar epimerase
LIVNLLTARAFLDHRITIFNQTQWRPFIHVEDISRAFRACLEAPTSLVANEIFNVGAERLNATLGDLARLVQEQIPEVAVDYIENTDHRNYRVSFNKISAALGFTCLHTLRDGICEVKRAFEAGIILDHRDPVYHNDRTLELLKTRAPREELPSVAGTSERFLHRAASAPAFG